MAEIKRKCIQCRCEKTLDEYFNYAKSGKPYSWCKECVRASVATSKENHVSKAKMFRERWGQNAI